MQRSILADIAKFEIEVSEYDQVVRTITRCSIGRQGHRTPMFENGSLSLTKRDRDHVSSIYHAQMPFALFFQQDLSCAFHQGDVAVPSHGCIHLEEPDARWLFEWAADNPVGLTVRGPYPASSVPAQTLYRFGAPNMAIATVTRIQQSLVTAGLDPGPADGEFRDRTDQAVRDFQTARAMVVDGVVGRDTAAALGVAL